MENRKELLYKLFQVIKIDEKLIIKIKQFSKERRGKLITVLAVKYDQDFKDFIVENMTKSNYKKCAGLKIPCDVKNLYIIIMLEGNIYSGFIELSLL